MSGRVRWLLPLAWTAVIAWGSSDHWGATTTRGRLVPAIAQLLPWLGPDAVEALHWLIRKGGHVTEYSVLALLWGQALGGWRRAGGLSVLTAFLDELHQSTTLAREGSAADVVLDSTSALLALAILRGGVGVTLQGVATALLWAAAVGGTGLLVVDVAAGAPPGWLWPASACAWLALALRRYLRSPVAP